MHLITPLAVLPFIICYNEQCCSRSSNSAYIGILSFAVACVFMYILVPLSVSVVGLIIENNKKFKQIDKLLYL